MGQAYIGLACGYSRFTSGSSDRAPPRETSAIWALKFHTDDVVLTRIRSNESDWSICLTPRNGKQSGKQGDGKWNLALGYLSKVCQSCLMQLISCKLSPLGKSSFALYTFICGQNVFVNLPTGSGKSLIFPGVAKSRNARMLQCCNARNWKPEY